MSTASLEITGVDALREKLRAAGRRYKDAAAAALYDEALAIRTDAMRRTPVDTGRLRDTCFVTPPDTSGDELETTIGFDTDYAVAVHERTEVRHPTGEAKFLENAMNEASAGYLTRIAEKIQRYAESGIGFRGTDAPTGAGGGS